MEVTLGLSILSHSAAPVSQDMSIAGKRAGLDGERSSLFYQAIRIIKEMREKSNGKYPRWAVWENVTGAMSSNNGEDFRCVLEAFCKIKDADAHVPKPAKWRNAGLILGGDYSVAWRTLDAAGWGVPQRRKRIFLVADLADECAGKVLFISEGMSGYSAQSIRAWQGAAGNSEESAGAAGRTTTGEGQLAATLYAAYGTKWNEKTGAMNGDNFVAEFLVLNDQGGNRMDVTEEVTATLRAEAHHPPVVMESAGFCTEHSAKARSIGYEEENPQRFEPVLFRQRLRLSIIQQTAGSGFPKVEMFRQYAAVPGRAAIMFRCSWRRMFPSH